MDVMILRLLLDSSFFLAVFNPLITGENPVMRWGLPAILVGWLIWIVMNWKKRDLEGRIHDMAMTEVKILAVIQLCFFVPVVLWAEARRKRSSGEPMVLNLY